MTWIVSVSVSVSFLPSFAQGFDAEKVKKIVKIKEERGARVGR